MEVVGKPMCDLNDKARRGNKPFSQRGKRGFGVF